MDGVIVHGLKNDLNMSVDETLPCPIYLVEWKRIHQVSLNQSRYE